MPVRERIPYFPRTTSIPRTLLFACVFAGAVAGCAGPGGTATQETTTERPVAADTAASPAVTLIEEEAAPSTTEPTFVEQTGPGPGTEAAFTELRRGEGGRIVRWERQVVTVAVAGEVTTTDMETLAVALRGLSSVAGVPRLELVDGANGDVDVNFLTKQRWGEKIANLVVGEDVDGQARYVHEDGVIREATVVVDSSSSQLQRNRTIVHELLHSLGLGHHSCRGALLYGGAEYDPRWELREYDTVLLEAWYREHAGIPSVGRDLPCPEVAWDSVLFEGNVLWCRTDGRECYPVDEQAGVRTSEAPLWLGDDGTISDYDPERYTRFSTEDGEVLCRTEADTYGYQGCRLGARSEVSDPDRWLGDGTVYDYHPGTHIVRLFEGRRLLCEKPATQPGPRTPCQYTDGAVLTGIDLYTDGQYVYPDQ
jgi:hypothetical protein